MILFISETLSHCWPITPSNGFDGYDFGNLYSKQDTLFNGEYGFSGSSGDWVKTWFSWHCLLANKAENRSFYQSDTTILRFNFISDSIDTKKEGWIIDDILLFAGDLGSSVNDIVQDIFTISPNPMKESTTISLDNYMKNIDIDILDTNGRIFIHKVNQKGDSFLIKRNGLIPGVYLVKIKTSNGFISIKKLIVE